MKLTKLEALLESKKQSLYTLVKNSAEDYESQGGKITKKFINQSLEQMCDGCDDDEIEKARKDLFDVFGLA